jgi:hypothetical protein
MYCSYHTSHAARVQCASCARALCAACDHRIKGYPYCQDCIVTGIENLSRRGYSNEPPPRRHARVAALCAVLPGMGAVYNRQNIKAVVHFVAIIGLIQLTHVRVLSGVFALAAILFYAYSIIDAYRTAQLIATGESPEADEERFKRSLVKRAPVVGVVLIISGLLLVIQLVRPLAFITYARLLPVALIILGGYLLTRYFKRKREDDYGRDYPKQPPYPLIPDSFDHKQSGKVRPMWGPRGQR